MKNEREGGIVNPPVLNVAKGIVGNSQMCKERTTLISVAA